MLLWTLRRRVGGFAVSPSRVPTSRARCNHNRCDLPALGRSGRPARRDYSLAKHAQYLAAVLEASVDRPAVPVGHSLGGMITLTFCKL